MLPGARNLALCPTGWSSDALVRFGWFMHHSQSLVYRRVSGWPTARNGFSGREVSGWDRTDTGFKPRHIAADGIRPTLAGTASRFAYDPMIRRAGHRMPKEPGIVVIAADARARAATTLTARLIRQVIGAASRSWKAMLVPQIIRARDRKRATRLEWDARRSGQPRQGGLGRPVLLLPVGGHTGPSGRYRSASVKPAM